VTAYTVSNLEPANVTIPGYTPKGQLWQADVNVQAHSGVVTPVVSNFNARAGEQNYRVISVPATPQGVSPAPITQGASTTGKLYFDVTGAAPTAVVYNDGMQDVLVWEANPANMPAPETVPGQLPNTVPGQPNPAQTVPGQPNPAQTAPGQPNPAQPAPGAGMGTEAPAETAPGAGLGVESPAQA
jgi:hypothetical protein